jgi:hypothetical protein
MRICATTQPPSLMHVFDDAVEVAVVPATDRGVGEQGTHEQVVCCRFSSALRLTKIQTNNTNNTNTQSTFKNNANKKVVVETLEQDSE